VLELIDVARHFNRPIRPQLVLVTYEELLPQSSQAIKAGLDCLPVSLYGTSELGLCAWQCSAGAFHFPSDAIHAEVLTGEGKPAPPGAIGSLVITSLKSWAMPLIRYDTGDLARRSPSKRCACGSTEQFVTAVEGRRDVHLRDSHGRPYLTYEPLGLIDSCGLVDFQVVQRTQGLIHIVVPKQVSASDPRCKRAVTRLRHYFNNSMKVELETTGAFQYTSSGKRNAVVTDAHRFPT
jgi:phenylacetate-CoA ligase